MSDKSHVTMEQKVCVVCHEHFDTQAILLDQRIRPVFEAKTITGYGWCPKHQKLKDDGFIMLVGIDDTKSSPPYKPNTVYHTGGIAMVKREAWGKIFTVPVPVSNMCYVDEPTLARLQAIMVEAEAAAKGDSGEEAAEG